MKNVKSLEKKLKLAEKQILNLRQYSTQLNANYEVLLKKDAIKRKIYDLNYRINSLRREKSNLEVELKKLFEK